MLIDKFIHLPYKKDMQRLQLNAIISFQFYRETTKLFTTYPLGARIESNSRTKIWQLKQTYKKEAKMLADICLNLLIVKKISFLRETLKISTDGICA